MPGWSLHDRAFLITGGARGIGAATAQALHARGARLALVEVNLLGAFRTVRAALPHVQARRGYVVFTASAATFSHGPGMGAHATHPVSKAVDAIVRGFERRSRRVFVPEWVRVLHWTRAAIHTPLAERQIVKDVPEVLATYEREAREKGPDEVAWSERTRDVLRGG